MYRVLLPVDTSEERASNAASAITNLPAAGKEVAVTVVNVFEEFDAIDGGGRVKSEDLFEDYERPASVDVVGELLEESGIEWTFRPEHGEPAETIIEVAGEEEVDVITMSGGDQSPVGKVLFGSVTQGVLLNADRPVTIV